MRRWNDAPALPSAESRCEFGIGADDCVSSRARVSGAAVETLASAEGSRSEGCWRVSRLGAEVDERFGPSEERGPSLEGVNRRSYPAPFPGRCGLSARPPRPLRLPYCSLRGGTTRSAGGKVAHRRQVA
jgi:hypothetical protein